MPRIFQNSSMGRQYKSLFRDLVQPTDSFSDMISLFHEHRHDVAHTLEPVLQKQKTAFYTHGDTSYLQRAWARENGGRSLKTKEDILLAQIEEHRTEIFYNLDPHSFDASFLKRLPASVKHSICWLAAPFSTRIDLRGFHMVCNFNFILDDWRSYGLKASYLSPALPDEFHNAQKQPDRDIDILFVGTFSQYHLNRVKTLVRIADLADEYNIYFALSASRLTRLAEIIGEPFNFLIKKNARPKSIQKIAMSPVYGLQYFDLLQRAKITINGAIDMSQNERGNMRCFEAMSLGSLLLTDKGLYPEGFEDGHNYISYEDAQDCQSKAKTLLFEDAHRQTITKNAYDVQRRLYNKSAQYQHFLNIL